MDIEEVAQDEDDINGEQESNKEGQGDCVAFHKDFPHDLRALSEQRDSRTFKMWPGFMTSRNGRAGAVTKLLVPIKWLHWAGHRWGSPLLMGRKSWGD